MAVTICLTMIVKNESRIIRRCLDAAKFCIDFVSICDTGSTDTTVDIINQWGKENNIPTKTHFEPWKNFGYNRTIAYKKAKEAFPQAKYLLLLDADMVLVDKGFNKQGINGDAYHILQTEGGTTYRNIRLIRAELPWKSFGVTHEYTGVENGSSKTENLDTLWIDDRSDGGSKDDKLDRDASLLMQGLKDEPENSRYYFYLANTFFSLNQYLDAIYWYEKRIQDKANKFEEEAWYAMYRLGHCYENMNDYPKMTYWYMKAINRRPHRIEPYVRLAKVFIFNDNELQYFTGCKLIRDGLGFARQEVDVLFVEDSMYDYEAWFCLAVGSYWIGRIAEGRAACQKVIASQKAPQNYKQACQKFLQDFYK